MKSNNIDPEKFKALLSKGLELTFARLLKQKKAVNGFFILSEKGQIRKIKAADLIA